MQERSSVVDGVVYVRLSREVEDSPRHVFQQETLYIARIRYVTHMDPDGIPHWHDIARVSGVG
jgi:hypothetical protein